MKNLDYGLIGNCTSAALVSRYGCIEWCCLPTFDSSSVFAKMLDRKGGGEFGIRVSSDYTIEQGYIPKTNVLETTFTRGKDIFRLIDFMPRYKTDAGLYHCPPDIIRYIQHVSGKPEIRIIYKPRPAYSQHDVKTEVRKAYIKTGTVKGSYESVYLYSDLDLASIDGGRPVTIDRDHYLLLSYNQKIGYLLGFLGSLYFILPLILGGLFDNDYLMVFSPFGLLVGYEMYNELEELAPEFIVNLILLLPLLVLIASRYSKIAKLRSRIEASN